ncbi:MAG TPA: KH domain-containing protein [Patescibacteria group bacterium]|nr:KH domain-containing protein [Patescibacteria group bacterium]
MKDILEYIVKNLVEDPATISVTEEEIDGVVTLTITPSKEDMGKLIGKGGRVIRAIRNLMKIPAMKQNKKVQVQLAEV